MPKINTRKEYDAIKALNYSGAKELLKSPAHYQAWLNEPRKETPALAVGTAVHAEILQPQIASEIYAVAPDVDRRTKDGKAQWEAFVSQNQGKAVITGDQQITVCNVATAALKALTANGITFDSTELMTYHESIVPLKFAIDAVGSDGYLYDIKTTEDATPRGFKSSAISYKYYLQAFFYYQCYWWATKSKPAGFRFIVVEKNPPYAVAIYELGPTLMQWGADDFNKAIDLYKKCTDSGEWPGFPNDPQIIDVEAKTTTTPIAFA